MSCIEGKYYCEGINDGAEIFRKFASLLVKMGDSERQMLFGESSVYNILNQNSSNEIMARIGARK